ncbi:YciE/YciF ferroxidase family protein [Flavobacterium rhizosphaerae]|uniref:DUF892 family protein n=1 Tax=Flavobacterium rhizosphaerae TaxID=3163298 RepID=A0ABW8YX80_9FLAO
MQANVVKEYSDQYRELRGLFEKQLMELYWTEGVMGNMLNGVIVQSSSKDLVTVLQKHHEETLTHIERLEKIFNYIGIPAQEKEYEAIDCFVKEAESIIHITRQGVVRDAAIIAVLQKIMHYEIACYGTMRAYAIALREEDVVMLLEQTLQDEKGADLMLSSIAESHINTEAADKEI